MLTEFLRLGPIQRWHDIEESFVSVKAFYPVIVVKTNLNIWILIHTPGQRSLHSAMLDITVFIVLLNIRLLWTSLALWSSCSWVANPYVNRNGAFTYLTVGERFLKRTGVIWRANRKEKYDLGVLVNRSVLTAYGQGIIVNEEEYLQLIHHQEFIAADHMDSTWICARSFYYGHPNSTHREGYKEDLGDSITLPLRAYSSPAS